MTVPIFVSAADEISAALDSATAAQADGARVIEWRIDALADDPAAETALVRLVRESPAPCIVTCRPTWEGGLFDGEERTRFSLLQAPAAHDAPPRYVDVEWVAWQRSANLRQKVGLATKHESTGLILSYHDFTGRPADLLQAVDAMQREPECAVVKIAWMARSLRDNLEAFELLAARSGPMIALTMGEYGLMSRVLAPKFGGLITFAAAAAGGETAPGQPTIRELRERFRFDAIGAATRVYGVIGWPVAHSQSPELHNRGFEIVGHDGVYLPLPVPPEWEHFKATVGALVDDPRLDFRGASVTIPHKAHLLRFVEERGGTIDPLAQRVGAANTLVVDDDGALRALNTDCPALVAALGAVDAQRVAVLGAGGVARAAVAGLVDAGANVTIFNRTPQRAAELAALFGAGHAPLETFDSDAFDVIVNATSVGMEGGPDPDGMPLPDGTTFRAEQRVFDTVYTPRDTPLLQAATRDGATALSGWSMFQRQAALQFQAWTGLSAPWDDAPTG